jgi:hypothetical protein
MPSKASHTDQVPESSLLGRARELDELSVAIGDARAGSGGVWLLAGEPGIGKSRLCEEVARRAAREGLLVAWGAAWEAGGAPAYWPWLQVLRHILANVAIDTLTKQIGAARCAPLITLLPELSEQWAHQLGSERDSKVARFALLDAITAVLMNAAREKPCFIVLEDLHAADPESIELIEFAAAALRSSAITIVGTFREAEAAKSQSAAAFQRITGRAHTLTLQRLRRHEVAAHLESVIGEAPPDPLVSAVYDATEGNPLFLVETTRLLVARGTQAGVQLPSSVRAAIRERLSALPTSAGEVCEMASVIGREFLRTTLASMSGRQPVELAVPLAAAIDAAVLFEVAPGDYRFTHGLFRDVLYTDLEPLRREQFHRTLADTLQRDGASLSEIAHHYLEAGSGARSVAIEGARAAAAHARSQFAFAEAAKLFRAAVGAASAATPRDDALVSQLYIDLGRAQIDAGEIDGGRASCREAARLARVAGSGVLLAHSALAYGSVFVIANVDPTLVALLKEAAAALESGEPGLRARVLARLAAAMQPADEPAEPIALARHAIDLAREQGDPATLLEVMRASISAMMDLVGAPECMPLHREHVALAEQLQDRTEALRGMLRLSLACVAIGEISEARATLTRAEEIATELGHPHYRWRIAVMRAAEAAFLGDFNLCHACFARATDLASRSGDPNATGALLAAKASHLRLQARSAEAAALMQPAMQTSDTLGRAFIRVLLDSVETRAAPTPKLPDAQSAELVIHLKDHTMFEHAAEICAAANDRTRAERLLALVSASRERFEQGGMYAMSWDGPIARVLGLLHATLGNEPEARRAFEQAIDDACAVSSVTHETWARWDYGRFLSTRDPNAAAQQFARLAPLARQLEMPDLVSALASFELRPATLPLPSASQPSAANPRQLCMTREADVWLLSYGECSLRLNHSKGLRILDLLVAEPRREYHVLDLIEPTGAIDTGDAGEILDPQARAEYRERVASLRAQLAQAEADHDLGRVERLQTELEALLQELSRAVGLSGRVRKSGAAVERARVNVQRRLRDALRRISENDAELGRQLERALRTGTFCSYDP